MYSPASQALLLTGFVARADKVSAPRQFELHAYPFTYNAEFGLNQRCQV